YGVGSEGAWCLLVVVGKLQVEASGMGLTNTCGGFGSGTFGTLLQLLRGCNESVRIFFAGLNSDSNSLGGFLRFLRFLLDVGSNKALDIVLDGTLGGEFFCCSGEKKLSEGGIIST